MYKKSDTKPHFNPENIFQVRDKFIYVGPGGDWHDVTDLPVGWICDAGHTWEDSIGNRTAGAECPTCLNQLA